VCVCVCVRERDYQYYSSTAYPVIRVKCEESSMQQERLRENKTVTLKSIENPSNFKGALDVKVNCRGLQKFCKKMFCM